MSTPAATPRTSPFLSGKPVLLWHPESPGMRVLVKPSFLRRLGLIRAPFATLGEVIRHYKVVARKSHGK